MAPTDVSFPGWTAGRTAGGHVAAVEGEGCFRAMVYYSRIALRALIPTVIVRLATEEGEIAFRARWKHSPLALQRAILFRMRAGRPLWFEDDTGRDLVFKPEKVWAAMVDGR